MAKNSSNTFYQNGISINYIWLMHNKIINEKKTTIAVRS